MHVERQDGGTSPKCDRAALEVPSNHMQLVLHLAASSAIWVWATCTSILLIRSSLRGVRRPQLAEAKNEAHHRQRVVSRLRMSHAKGAPRRPDAADPSHAARGDLTPSVRTRRPSAEPSPVMWCTGIEIGRGAAATAEAVIVG